MRVVRTTQVASGRGSVVPYLRPCQPAYPPPAQLRPCQPAHPPPAHLRRCCRCQRLIADVRLSSCYSCKHDTCDECGVDGRCVTCGCHGSGRGLSAVHRIATLPPPAAKIALRAMQHALLHGRGKAWDFVTPSKQPILRALAPELATASGRVALCLWLRPQPLRDCRCHARPIGSSLACCRCESRTRPLFPCSYCLHHTCALCGIVPARVDIPVLCYHEVHESEHLTLLVPVAEDHLCRLFLGAIAHFDVEATAMPDAVASVETAIWSMLFPPPDAPTPLPLRTETPHLLHRVVWYNPSPTNSSAPQSSVLQRICLVGVEKALDD